MAGKRKIKINKGELRKIIKEYIMEAISTPSLSVIAKKTRQTELPDVNLLKEGIFRSYDTSFVVRYLSEKLNFTTNQEVFSNYQAEGFVFTEEEYNGGCDNVNVVIPSSYKRMDDLNKIMVACGYIKAHEEKLHKGLFLKLEYEKNIQDEIRGLVGKYKYIYHLTPSIYVNKIMKQGLVPRSNNEFFNYTPRIYFLLDKKTINYKYVAEMLYNKKIESAGDNNEEIELLKKYKDNYTLLRCKTSNLVGKVKFYIDNNLPNSVYVTENISPQYIEIDEEDIKVE